MKSRRLTSVVMSFLIIFSALTAMNFTSMNVLAEYHDEDWEITDHQWRENVNITLDECNLVIKYGGTLTFNNSVNLSIINPAPPTRYGITIEAGGKFEINSNSANTKIISGSTPVSRTYSFTNSGTIDFLGATVERVYGNPDAKSTTGGIRNLAGSVCNLTNCNIMDADTHSLFVNGTSGSGAVELNIKNTEITNTTSGVLDGTGIWIKGNVDVEIDNVTIEGIKNEGIKCEDANNVSITNSTIEDVDESAYCIRLNNANNTMIRDNAISGGYMGIYLEINSSYNTITCNNVSNTNCTGIYLDDDVYDNGTPPNNNTITNNSCWNNEYCGIEQTVSNDNVISNNICGLNRVGVGLCGSKNTVISNNILDYNTNAHEGENCGIYLTECSNTTVFNNSCVGNERGIQMDGHCNDTVTYNNCSMNSEYGIYLDRTSNNTISNNDCSDNGYGLYMLSSSNLGQSIGNFITNNTFSGNDYGVYIEEYSHNNFIYHNNILSNTDQSLDDGTDNSWDNGYPSGGNYWSDYNGVDVKYGSNQNTDGADGIGDSPYDITGSASEEDNYPLMGPIIDGRFMKPSFRIDSDNDFDTKSWIAPTGDGTVNNPWVIESYYIDGTGEGCCVYIGNTTEYFKIDNCKLYDASGNSGTYFWNSGLTLYNSIYGQVSNINSDSSYYGILLCDSDDNKIDNSTLSNNNHGIYLAEESDSNTIEYNQVTSNTEDGIIIDGSDENTVNNNVVSSNIKGVFINDAEDNTITNNIFNSNEYGLYSEDSYYNTVRNNNFTTNTEYGLYINGDSNNNEIYHNNIINNTNQSHDSGTNNAWDNGYPSGGNYWDNYTGVDVKYGFYQNLNGADGFGDSDFITAGSAGSTDNYPLMGPIVDGRFMKPSFRIDSDSDFDTKSWIAPSGSGTENDPWVIENYYINGTGEGYCAYVGNTTDYFVIRNCKMSGASDGTLDPYFEDSGVILYNLENGTIEDNTITSHDFIGIYLSSADNNVIENNIVNTNAVMGIGLDQSDGNEIKNNTVNSNDELGIYLAGSNYNEFDGNIITSNADVGIYFDDGSDHNKISNNTIKSNGYGIYLTNSNYINITANNISENEYGIYIEASNWSNITYNDITDNDDYGVYLDADTHNITIYHNNFIGNTANGEDQAYDDGTDNSWDAGSTIGGNYWSDYAEPYDIDGAANESDDYPFNEEDGWE